MKILYYTWSENSKLDMEQTLLKLGHEVVTTSIPFSNYEKDIVFEEQFEHVINESKCDAIFSFNFFPLIAKSAEKAKKKYVSWVYDSPHRTLYSPSAKSEYSYVFLFDRMQYIELQSRNILHLFHFPLAVNTTRLNQQLGELTMETAYKDEVSFVGSLYEKNMYDQINYLPDQLRGYIDGLMAAQSKVYGYNFIKELITDEVTSEINKYVSLNFDPSYQLKDNVLYSDMVNAKLTSMERVCYLEDVAQRYPFTLYTASDTSLVPGAKNGGILSYDKEMPKVFRKSKINLNITLRSIESGIPLRALDIMGAGGFLLSNYQPELAEYFVDGKEVVLFTSQEDMLEKIDYYLNHDAERQEIAIRGWEKVQKEFSYEIQLKKIFDLINE